MSTSNSPAAGFRPEDMHRLRVDGRVPMNIWDAAACGLIGGAGCAGRLSGLEFGSEDDVREPSRDEVRTGTWLARDPSYTPYESSAVPRHAAGDRLAVAAIETVFSSEVVASVSASPLTAIVMAAAASVRVNLSSAPGGRLLTALAAAAPKKGGEINRLIPEYCARNAATPEDAATMAIRDYFASWFAWCFPRCLDGRMPDLWGSAFCLTTAVDYVGVADAAGTFGSEEYLAAASEGLACLRGDIATQVLRDLIVADAFMQVKATAVSAVRGVDDPADYFDANGHPVTPTEVLRARIWDGVYYVILRAIMSESGYRHLTDRQGNFSAADRCGRIKRALDNGIRYDEIIDVASDYTQGEWLNELCVAFAMRGSRAVMGYGDACARATDDAIECPCGELGHEAAAEVSMGNLLFYLVTPRYVVQRQLATYSEVGGYVQEAFAWPAAGARLLAAARTHLSSGDTLHAANWEPLWTAQDAAPSDAVSPARELARRAVRRSFVGAPGAMAARDCEAIAEQILTACDELDDLSQLRALDARWCEFFDAVLDRLITDQCARRQADAELRPLIGQIWRQAIVGHDDARDRSDERLYLDVDAAIRRTFSLEPPEGLAIRRAFLGVTTGAAELSGLNPCARLSDGVAGLMSDAEAFGETMCTSSAARAGRA
ncbi:hypothetical protein NN3_41690 [Nocardia neocaledoniensis NBRC 108232]|uniref:Uncharacterized protein n=1 Tax=Nocardia neocaledoniensis TaxID=236511 RepID=A0A317NGT0_9NOCA|nr:hypothetical protein [Nocardia neocaledoniensis]PWV74521.1 hypothetical protein DFR69_106332 [Nocardia neocaledoniensis]GEM33162.1 hypothetical protein NN3_41690 [Nocardia neocaledoniensis NBRC 108232]